jgi:hypothetical protein
MKVAIRARPRGHPWVAFGWFAAAVLLGLTFQLLGEWLFVEGWIPLGVAVRARRLAATLGIGSIGIGYFLAASRSGRGWPLVWSVAATAMYVGLARPYAPFLVPNWKSAVLLAVLAGALVRPWGDWGWFARAAGLTGAGLSHILVAPLIWSLPYGSQILPTMAVVGLYLTWLGLTETVTRRWPVPPSRFIAFRFVLALGTPALTAPLMFIVLLSMAVAAARSSSAPDPMTTGIFVVVGLSILAGAIGFAGGVLMAITLPGWGQWSSSDKNSLQDLGGSG